MWQDIRLAVRGFRKTPVFSLVAVATLALAIGANTALFSLLNALVLRDVAVRDPHTLVQVSGLRPGSTTRTGLTFPMYEELQRRQQSFSAVLGWLGPSIVNIETDRDQTQGAVWVVSGDFYDELGVRPLAGRLLDPHDVNEAEPRSVAVIGHSFWQRHFGADRSVVGKRIRIQNESFEIIGIAPAGFRALDLTIEPDVTLPLTAFPLIADSAGTSLRSDSSLWVRTTARLKPGVTIEGARVALDTEWPDLKRTTVPSQYTAAQRERFLAMRLSVESAATGVEQSLRETFATPLIIVFAISGLILIIACVNLASLMLSRAASRVPEITVRLALGASRWRIVRQTLVEGVLLSSVGAACGVWLACWSTNALVTVMFRDYLVSASLLVAPDAHVLALVAMAAILTGMLFSTAPAWLASRLEASGLWQRSTRTISATGRVGKQLVAAQVGLSMILLTNAGLLVRTLQEVRSVKPGIQTDGVSVASLAPRPGGQIGLDNDVYYPALTDRVAAVPGVKGVGVSLFRPGGGSGGAERVSPAGTPTDQPGVDSLFMSISPGLFDALGVSLKAGRDLRWSDNSRGHAVAVLSESLARRLFPAAESIGQHVRVGVLPQRQTAEVVGVVADARIYDVKNGNAAAVYVPALQERDNSYKSLVIRGGRVSADDLDRAVASFGHDRVRFIRTLDYITGRALLRERITAVLATFFGGLALLLAAIGLYGLMSYAVAQRQREIGIRMALGADARRLLGTVVGEGLMITLVGVAGGLAAALVSVRLVKSLLFGVTTGDPITLVAGPVALVAIAVVACLLPATRAARTDPMVALRAE